MTLRRRASRVLVVLLGTLAVLYALAHTAWVESRVLAAVLARLSPDGSMRAERLEYAIHALRFRLHGVALSDGASEPYFEATEIGVDIPWSVFGGELSLQTVDVVDPVFNVVVDAAGASNLDQSSTGFDVPLPIERFVIENLSLRWRDARDPGFGLRVDGLQIELSGSTPAAIGGPSDAFATLGAERVVLDLRVGGLAWDGRDVQVRDGVFGAAGAELRVDGSIGRALSDAELGLDIGLDLDAARIGEIAGASFDVAGSASFQGRLGGVPADALLSGIVSSDQFRWQALQLDNIVAQIQLDAGAVRVAGARADVAGGSVALDGSVAFDAASSSTLTVGWDGIASALLPLPELGVPVDVNTAGSLALNWPGLVPTLDSIALVAEAVAMPGNGPRPAIQVRASAELYLEPGAPTRLTAELPEVDLRGLTRLFDASAALELAGTAAGKVDLRWPGAVPSADTVVGDVEVELPRLTFEGIGGSGRLAVSVDRGAWRAHIDGSSSQLGGVAAELAGDLAADTVEGSVEATVNVRASLLGQWMPAAPPVDGIFQTHFDVGGTLHAPVARGAFTSTQLTVGDEPVQEASAAFEASVAQLRLTDLVIRGDSIDARGDLSWDRRLEAVQGQLAGSIADLGRLVAWLPSTSVSIPDDLQGRLMFDVLFDGPLPTGNLTGSFTATQLGAHGITDIDAFARLSRSPFGIRIDELLLEQGANRVLVGGVVASDARVVDVLVDIDIVQPGRLAGSTQLSSVERLRAEVGVGWDAAQGQAIVDLWDLNIDLTNLPLRSPRPGRITVSADQILVETLSLQSGSATVDASGTLSTVDTELGLRLQVAGDLGEFSDLATLAARLAVEDPEAAPELRLTGSIQGDVRILGTREAPRPTGWLELIDASLTWQNLGTLTGIEARLEAAAEGLSVKLTEASWRGFEFHAEGAIPWALVPLPEGLPALGPALVDSEVRGTLGVDADAVSLDFDGIPAELRDADFSARARLSASASELSLDAVHGDLTLERLEMRAASLVLAQERPTVLSLRQQRVAFEDLAWALTDGTHQGRVEMAGAATVDGSHLDLDATIDLPLAALSGLAPGAAIAGRLHGAVHLGGTSAAPDTSGTLTISDGTLASSEPRMVLNEVEGSFDFAGTRVLADDLSARINGGDLTGSLSVDLASRPRPTGLASARVRSMVLESRGARVLADADLSLSVAADSPPRLFGEIRLQGGGYRSRKSLASEFLGLTGGALPATAPPSLLDEIQYDVRVRNLDPLVVDTPYAELGLEADLQLAGTYLRPLLLGRVNVVEGGRFRLAGNSYTVEEGALDFVDPARFAPVLDVRARAQIGGEKITVTLAGDAFDPDVAATAESGLDSGDVLSLMATGRTLHQAGEAGQRVLSEQAFEVLTGQYLAGTARSLGFDSFSFERAGTAAGSSDSELFPRDTDFASRLTLTRSFDTFFDLVFSQNLSNTEERSWIGTVRLPHALSLRAGTFDDGSNSMELQNTITLGGRAVTTRAARSRVGSVTLQGEIEPWRTELESVLRVRPGSEFDFLRWQEDRDRILDRLHELGRYEARVRSTRAASGTASVELVHDIAPGPQTVLDVVGELDAAGRRSLRNAWADALVDEFLVDDLVAAARERLLERGHANPQVDVSVILSDAAKTAEVQVVPGARHRVRAPSLTGNHGLPSTEILERLRLAALPASGWARPQAVSEAVRDLYWQRGWIRASVQTSGPVVSGDGARLHVTIVEGERYALSALTFTGNSAIDDATLRNDVTVAAGVAWGRAALDAAITAVTDAYLERGYNQVRVVPQVSLDGGGPYVTLDLGIDEGRQQVLVAIEIEGLGRIRRGVVEASLDLQVGAPMRLATVQRARRRLHALGVFSRVAIRTESRGALDAGREAVAAVITVAERPAAVLRYGLQVFSEETLEDQRETTTGVAATAVHSGLFGLAADASLTARYRPNQRLLRGRIGFRRFFGLPVSTNLIGELARRDEEGFFTTRIADTVATLEQSVRPVAGLSVGYAFSVKRTGVTLLTDLEVPQLDPVTSVRVVPTVVYDTRDDAFAPRRGMFHSLSFQWAPSGLGSELLFRKLSTRHYGFLPLGPLTIATAIRFGSGASLDPTSDDLPRGELFLAGGGTSVRGYPNDSLGGSDFFGRFVPGGNAVLVVNQELRFPLWRWFEGVAFFDAGRSFPDLASIHLGDLNTAAGAGIRLVTPYLMLRLDYGLRLTDAENFGDAPRGRFHFGIGHVF